ncbi:hypothetical protein TL16_g07434 [Triparma laevis f. inornata]|uniref:Uncharacterized protein n=1 Tax=Triparma laevis f. inornata TaxID=1714386 RepID=A0A9W7B006_9STRA|nr:hypothetical protein TL16_g07434 [Triparma laevis f. inornata]
MSSSRLKNYAIRNAESTDPLPSSSCPSESASLLSRLTYNYFTHTFRGNSPVYEPPESIKTRNLGEVVSGEMSRDSLLRTLFNLNKKDLYPSFLFQFLNLIGQSTQPLALKWLIDTVVSEGNSNIYGPGLASAFTMMSLLLLSSLSNHYTLNLTTRIGIRSRSYLLKILYSQTLNSTRNSNNSTDLDNLVNVDTENIRTCLNDINLFWSCPLQIVLVTILLVIVIGWEGVLGTISLFLFVPLVNFIVKAMIRIRKSRMEVTDERTLWCTEYVKNVSSFKMNGWENPAKEEILRKRDVESEQSLKELKVWGITLCIMVVSPVIATFAIFSVKAYDSEGGKLSPGDVFGVLCLVGSLRFPINNLGRLMGNWGGLWVGVERIAEFCDGGVGDFESEDETELPTDIGVSIVNGEFRLGGGRILEYDEIVETKPNEITPINPTEVITPTCFVMKDINLILKTSTFTGIIGPVASGKTTLIRSLVGSIKPHVGRVVLDKSTGYASQESFILNSTVRDNILFGASYSEDRYNTCVWCCNLSKDFEQLTRGDMSELGERGVTLSGGQKARVGVCRALYLNESKVIALDDPLSALDAETGKLVFDRIRNCDLFKDKSVIVVTNAGWVCRSFDRLLLTYAGEIRFDGTWEDLREFECEDLELRNFIKSIVETAQRSTEGGKEQQKEEKAGEQKKDKLIMDEVAEEGIVKISTYIKWFNFAGGKWFIFLQITFLILDRGMYVMTELWLATWTSATTESVKFLGFEIPSQEENQDPWIIVYASLIIASIVAVAMRTEWAIYGGSRAARKMWREMLDGVVGAKMIFFETTPIGRLTTRFSYDTMNLDILLVQQMSVSMIASSWFVAR